MSNTEPLVRLNLETRGDEALLKQREEQILQLLEND
jgi:phosphomannomutase